MKSFYKLFLAGVLAVFFLSGAVYSAVVVPVESNPYGVVMDSSKGMAYVAGEKANSLSIVDLSTQSVVASIPIGRAPHGVAVDTVLNIAVVGNKQEGTVSIIDLSTSVVTSIVVGKEPEGISIDSSTHRAFVANRKDNSISVIDIVSQTVIQTIAVGHEPVDVAIDPVLNIALVVNQNDWSVSVIDLSTLSVIKTVSVGKLPKAIDINPETHTAVIVNEKDNTVSVINLIDWTTSTVLVGKHPVDVAVNRLDNTALVICDEDRSLQIIDLNTKTITKSYALNKQLRGVAVDSYINVAGISDDKTDSLTLIGLPNPIAVINSISPDTLLRGTKDAKVMIEGRGFIKSSTVSTGNTALSVTFIDNRHVEISIPESLLADTGTLQITITNPSPDGGTSNAISLKVNNPVPQISALEPMETTAGSPPINVNIFGTGLFEDTVCYINEIQRVVSYDSDHKAILSLTSDEMSSGRQLDVKAFNPEPGGGYSQKAIFTVKNPIPQITSISPDTVIRGSKGIKINLMGTGFVNASIVEEVNAKLIPTSIKVIDQDNIEVLLPDNAFKDTVEYKLDVKNPEPGGGASNQLTLKVVNPVPSISSVMPSETIAGTQSLALLINGTGFFSDTTFIVSGIQRAVVYDITSNAIMNMTAGEIETGKIIEISASNPTPGGGVSSSILFTVKNPIPILNSISPTNVDTGSGDITLTISGANFSKVSEVRFNNQKLTSSYISNSVISSIIPASILNTVGIYPVKLVNPTPGGGESSVINFQVKDPKPMIANIVCVSNCDGNNILAGSLSQFKVIGNNYKTITVISIGTQQVPSTFIDKNNMTVTYAFENSGAYSITAISDAFSSDPYSIFVKNPLPILTSINPTSVEAGSPDISIVISGAGFLKTSEVWAGIQKLSSTYSNNAELRAIMPSSLLTNTTTYQVKVKNPAPGGGEIGSLSFEVKQSKPKSSITALHEVITTEDCDWHYVADWDYYDYSCTTSEDVQPLQTLNAGQSYNVIVNGVGFESTTQVHLNNSYLFSYDGVQFYAYDLDGTFFSYNLEGVAFVNSTEMRMTLSVDRGGSFGLMAITNGAVSDPFAFDVLNPLPEIQEVNPSQAQITSSPVLVTIFGTGFVPNTEVYLNGVKINSTAYPNYIYAELPAGSCSQAGNLPIIVKNPTPGGGSTSTYNYQVLNVVPVISSINPPKTFTTNSPVNVNIYGSGFAPGAEVYLNGVKINASYQSFSYITAVLPTGACSHTGNLSIVVKNPAPGGETSSAMYFTVIDTTPVIQRVGDMHNRPTYVGTTYLYIFGTNLDLSSIVYVNGQPRNLDCYSNWEYWCAPERGYVAISLQTNDLSTAGTYEFKVMNSSGRVSAPYYLNVLNPVPYIYYINNTSNIIYSAGSNITARVSGAYNSFMPETVFYLQSQGGQNVATLSRSTANSNGYIDVTIPGSLQVGTYYLWAVNPAPGGGTSSQLTVTIAYPTPVISSLSPSTFDLVVGGASPSKTITVNGSNLSNATVFVGDVQIPVISSDFDHVVADVSQSFKQSGQYTIKVATSFGESNTASFTVTIAYPTPVISSLSPSTFTYFVGQGNQSKTMTISGSMFNNPSVYVDDIQIPVIYSDNNRIDADISQFAGKPGQHSVKVVSSYGTQSNAVSFTVNVNCDFSITSPSNYSWNDKRQTVLVSGVVNTATADVGISVNGVVADIYQGKWVASDIQLPVGWNLVNATLMDSYGQNCNRTIYYYSTGSPKFVELRANATRGIANLTTWFSVGTELPYPAVSYSIDFGDGSAVINGTSFEDVSHTYTGEGIYYPTVAFKATNGATFTDTITITVYNRTEIDTLLKGKWDGMRSSLAQEDVDNAVKDFDEFSKDSYKELFTGMSSVLPLISQELGDIRLITVRKNLAEYDIRTIRDGVEYSFYLIFIRNEEGIWKIRSF